LKSSITGTHGYIRTFSTFALALAIGLLVGIERGWQEREGAEGSRTAGIRTYALVGLLGGVWAALTPKFGALPLAVAAAAFAGAFTLFQYREVSAKEQFSVTGTVAGMLVFALGAYAVVGEMEIAGAAGAATVALLAARQICTSSCASSLGRSSVPACFCWQ